MAYKKHDFKNKDLLVSIEGLIRDGWDNKQVAKYLNYNETYFCKVIKENSELSEAIVRARKPLTFNVENSLYKRAVGMKVKTVIRRWAIDANGKQTDIEIIQETEQEIPPDTKAQQLWLSQKKPEVWNKQPLKVDATTNGKDINTSIVIEVIDRTEQIKKDDSGG